MSTPSGDPERSVAPARRSAWRRVLKWGWNASSVLAMLVLLGLLGWGVFGYITGRQLEQVLERLEAAGEPLTWRDLAMEPPVDDIEARIEDLFLGLENRGAAKQYAAAMALMSDAPEDEMRPLDAVSEALADDRLLSDSEQALISRYFTEHDLPLRLLIEAGAIDACTFNPFTDFPKVRNQYLQQSRSCARLLHTHALWSLRQKNDEVAAQSIVALARLVRLWDQQPAIGGHVFSGAYAASAASATAALVANADLTPQSWESVSAVLAERDDPHALRRVFQAERIKRLYEYVLNDYGWREPLERRRLVRELSVYEQAIAAASMPWPQQRSAIAAFDDLSDTAEQMLNWEIMVSTEAAKLAIIRCAQVAIEIRRFHDAHGRLPTTLVELELAINRSLPLDPFTGQPLKYILESNGFVVYSLADDLRDDGGKVDEPRRLDDSDVGLRVRFRHATGSRSPSASRLTGGQRMAVAGEEGGEGRRRVLMHSQHARCAAPWRGGRRCGWG